MKVKIYRLNKSLGLPYKANETDAGYDVMASEDVLFLPSEIKMVPLGIIAEAPEGYHFKLVLRSSMAYKRGFSLANSVGIIDHSFAGPNDEIKALIKAPPVEFYEKYNGILTPLDYNGQVSNVLKFKISAGERVGQLLLEENIIIEWEEQMDRDFNIQSRGGFGSSGE